MSKIYLAVAFVAGSAFDAALTGHVAPALLFTISALCLGVAGKVAAHG